MTYSGNIIQEVCNIDTDLCNKELDRTGNDTIKKICHELACLQQKSFPNKWTNTVMLNLTRNIIISSFDLKYYFVYETLNSHLADTGDSGLYPTTQKGIPAPH